MTVKWYDKPQPEWKMVVRGLYVDEADNSAHFFPEEFCVGIGIPPTDENLKRAIATTGVCPIIWPAA
jgi:hypothetical protein